MHNPHTEKSHTPNYVAHRMQRALIARRLNDLGTDRYARLTRYKYHDSGCPEVIIKGITIGEAVAVLNDFPGNTKGSYHVTGRDGNENHTVLVQYRQKSRRETIEIKVSVLAENPIQAVTSEQVQ